MPTLRGRLARLLVTVEREDPGADVLVVTTAWPVDESNVGLRPGGLLFRNAPQRPRAGNRYGIFVKRQVDSLRAAGLRCDVLFIRGFVSPLAYVVAAVVLRQLSRVKRPMYRVVHGHGGETLLPLQFCIRTRRLVSFSGSDLLGTFDWAGSVSMSSRARRTLLSMLSRLASATITKSAEMEGALPPSVRRRNYVLPNGVDREFFRPLNRDDARRQLGWPCAESIALFAAHPSVPGKGYHLAAAACMVARRQGVPVRLEIAQSLEPALMPVAMSAADLLIMTSLAEGSPNVVKEALMCNLPVVATPVGDVRELLTNVRPSYICHATPTALANAIIDCVRRAERSNGRDVALWLDECTIARRLLSIYDGLATRARPPTPA
jgi:teichuronic acid biosynthesis glycosyltransferase TuaC